MLSPETGDPGDTAATITGSLALTSTTTTAPTASAAVQAALAGVINVEIPGFEHDYTFYDTAFNLVTNGNTVTVRFEDLAADPENCDWDFNDHSWSISVQETIIPTAPPVANNDAYTITHDRPLIVHAGTGLLSNDFDPVDAPIYVIVISQPSHGSISSYQSGDLSSTLDGGFQYTPDSLYVGPDAFTYIVSNGVYESDPATVTIAVTNGAPSAQAETYIITEDERLRVINADNGTTFEGPDAPTAEWSTPTVGDSWYETTRTNYLLQNDSDPDNDILRAVLIDEPEHGTIAFYDDGTFVYSPDPNYLGTDSFTYLSTDGITDSEEQTVTIEIEPGITLDLDGRDITTQTIWMTEGEEHAYGLGVGTLTPGEILARTPRPPTAESGWVLETRLLTYDPSTLAIGTGTQTGEIDLLGVAGDVVLGVSAIRDLTGPSEFGLSSIGYEARWRKTTGRQMVILQVAAMGVGPKVVIRSVDFTTDHGVLLNNTQDVLSVRNSPRFADTELTWGGNSEPFSQTIDTIVKHTITYSTAGIPVGGILSGTVGVVNQVMPWLDGEYALRANVANSSTNVVQDKIPIHGLGLYKIGKMVWATSLKFGLGPNNVQVLTAHNSPVHMFVTFGTPRNPDDTNALKPTHVRMLTATLPIGTAYSKAREARTFRNQTGVPKPEQITYETLKQHKFALENSIVGDYKTFESAWLVRKYWTEKYPSRSHPNPANYRVGSDCISGAMFTIACNLIYGVPGNFVNTEYASKSKTESTTAVEFSTIKDQTARSKFVPGVDGKSYILQMWAGTGENAAANNFESCVVWSQGATTYYFPSGIAINGVTTVPVYATANEVLSVFTSFGWGVSIPSTAITAGRIQFYPNPTGQLNVYQFPTKDAEPNLIDIYS